ASKARSVCRGGRRLDMTNHDCILLNYSAQTIRLSAWMNERMHAVTATTNHLSYDGCYRAFCEVVASRNDASFHAQYRGNAGAGVDLGAINPHYKARSRNDASDDPDST